MVTSDKLIQVKNLKKHYNKGAIKALDDVSIDIHSGEVMVIIGPSGSGKSTFLRSLLTVRSFSTVWILPRRKFPALTVS